MLMDHVFQKFDFKYVESSEKIDKFVSKEMRPTLIDSHGYIYIYIYIYTYNLQFDH